MLKNHRREQSANATAGRHNRHADWGSVEDERRTESYGRPAPASEEYEIVISKVNNKQPAEESKKDGRISSNNNGATGFNNQNLRSHFASPSPDIGPHASRHNKNGSTSVTAPQRAQASAPKSKPLEVNISNIKQS